jgi:hypothetical protein
VGADPAETSIATPMLAAEDGDGTNGAAGPARSAAKKARAGHETAP